MKNSYSLGCGILLFFLATPHLFSQCFPDRHNTNLKDSWISCESKTSPNPTRGAEHWILYELDERKTVSSMQLWNLNHPDYLASGVKTIRIDYLAGNGNWVHHADYTLAKAEASGFYEGQELNLVSEFSTDNILLTFTENYGGNCYGIAEARIGLKAISTSTEEILADPFNVQISPNPFNAQTQVTIENIEGNTVLYQLVNYLGQVLVESELASVNGQAQFELSGAGLIPGAYQLIIIDEKRISSRKLFHQN